MSLEHSRHTDRSSPWAQRQLKNFLEIVDQIPPGAPVIIRLPVTMALTGLTNQQLWQLEKDGKFPKRSKLNPDGPPNGAAGHFLDEVLGWVQDRRASREAVR